MSPAPITTYRSLGYVGLVREATPGTGEAPSKFYKFIEPVSLKAVQDVMIYRDGNVRDLTVPLKQTAHYEGSFKALAYADEAAALTAWAMGKDTISGAGDPYTHTLTLLDTLPWLGGELGYAEDAMTTVVGMVDRIIDAKISQLVIEGAAGSQVFLTPTIQGLKADFQNTTPTAQVFNDGSGQGPYTFQQSVFTFTNLGSDSATLQGQVQSFKITLNQNNLVVYGPAQLPGIGIVERGREISLEFVVVFSTNSLYRVGYFGGTSGTAFLETIAAGTFNIVATCQASPLHNMSITCNAFDVEEVTPILNPNAELMTFAVKGRCVKVGATYPMTAIFKNAVNAAYTA